jgi:hypothetical protein
MKAHYIPHALVELLYRELPPEAVKVFAEKIRKDKKLATLFQAFRKAKAQLPEVQFHPSSRVINRILLYSAKTAI